MGGKPRIVSQQYLGSAEEVMAKLSEAPVGQPIRSRHKRFGDLAAVWSTLVRLDVAGIIDRGGAAARRRGRVGGHLHRVGVREPDRGPVLKRGFADWWATTAGPRWVKLGRGALDHRRFWDAMDRLGEARTAGDRDPASAGRWSAEFGLD